MSIVLVADYRNFKVGDKVRYLGGDRNAVSEIDILGESSEKEYSIGRLIVGEVYEIKGVDSGGDPYFRTHREGYFGGHRFYVLEYNAHCFELVDDKHSDTTSYTTKITELSKENEILRDQVDSLCEELSYVRAQLRKSLNKRVEYADELRNIEQFVKGAVDIALRNGKRNSDD